MACIPPFLGAILFCALQFIVFLFVLVGTPLSQFDVDNSDSCYTLFGLKSRCSNSRLYRTGTDAFRCRRRRDNMNAGAAFAIFSIFTTLAALAFGVLMILRIPCAVLFPLVLTCLSVVTILICWACVVSVYSNDLCGSPLGRFRNGMSYGAGFGLMVTAWCVQVANVVVLVLLSFF